MKVLLLSLFHPELVRGGAQQICYELFEGLKETQGVEPILLAAIDPSFSAFYKAGARITGFDGRPNEFLYLSRDYDYLWHKVPDPALLDSFREFLELTKPDVIHFHHFLLFGVDLITLARKTLPDVVIIFTLHEFISICAANGQMVRPKDGTLCDRASAVRCHQCFPDRGPDHFFLREQWIKKHFASVDRFTTPSAFMIDIFGRWGIETDRIQQVANAQTDLSPTRLPQAPRAKRNRFGFFGQFVDNKGLWVLIEAVSRLRAEGYTDFTVELNGDNIRYAGAERRAEIEAFLAAEQELPLKDRIVTMNGPYQVDQLNVRMARVDWCVAPSVWREAYGLVISEAWMFGRPVICSNVGAMVERVEHEHDGLLFNAGDARDLAATIRRACDEEGLWQRLAGNIARPSGRQPMVDQYLQVYAAAQVQEQ